MPIFRTSAFQKLLFRSKCFFTPQDILTIYKSQIQHKMGYWSTLIYGELLLSPLSTHQIPSRNTRLTKANRKSSTPLTQAQNRRPLSRNYESRPAANNYWSFISVIRKNLIKRTKHAQLCFFAKTLILTNSLLHSIFY